MGPREQHLQADRRLQQSIFLCFLLLATENSGDKFSGVSEPASRLFGEATWPLNSRHCPQGLGLSFFTHPSVGLLASCPPWDGRTFQFCLDTFSHKSVGQHHLYHVAWQKCPVVLHWVLLEKPCSRKSSSHTVIPFGQTQFSEKMKNLYLVPRQQAKLLYGVHFDQIRLVCYPIFNILLFVIICYFILQNIMS